MGEDAMNPNEPEQHQASNPPDSPSAPPGGSAGVATLPQVDEALKAFVEFERRIESLRATAADIELRERRLADQEKNVQAALADATRRNTEAEERAKGISKEIEHLAATRQELERKLEESASRIAGLDERERELGQRELELSSRAPSTASLETELNRLRAEAAAAREEADWTGQALAEVQRQFAEARSARENHESEIQSLKAAQQSAAGGRADLANRMRRQRLGNVRRRLKEDAKKLEQISRVLSDRQAKVSAAEKMISLQKSTLLETEAAREAAEKARAEAGAMLQAARRVQERYERRNTAATTMTFLASSLVTMALVAGGAWFGVSRAVPQVCRATSTLSMSPDAAELGEEKAASWEEYIAGLPEDPRFLEYAADRFKARGTKEFGSPIKVGALLEESLTFDAIGPGRISASLVGTGTEQTSRRLATLATSIATYANETRELRADGASTASDTAPSDQAEILENPRTAVFGIAAGIGAAVVLFAFIFGWRSLRSAVIHAVRETADVLPIGEKSDVELIAAVSQPADNSIQVKRTPRQ